MIRSLHLANFKPFQDFTVEFTNHNVLVGPNNAGKSSIIQALRLVDIAVRTWSRTRQRQFAIPQDRVPFSLRNALNLYASAGDAAEITCGFSEGTSVQVNITDGSSNPQASVSPTGRGFQTSISFLPPVGPLEEDERLLDRDHVRRTMNTHLAPRHFRNLWRHFPDEIEDFGNLLTETWPGVTLSQTEPNPAPDSRTGNLYMFYEEDRIEREVAWAGTGLQIWMQILTFLVKNRQANVLILDEPELYLHADVQRKIGVAAFNVPNSQIIIATHSVEIVNELEPDQIVTVEPLSARSIRLTDISAVQMAVSNLGSTQNIQLSRLARSRRCLFVEGNDFKLLKRLVRCIGREPWEEGRNFSIFPLEGFENWTFLKSIDWVFHNILNEYIQAFVILDRDYRTDSQVDAVMTELRRRGVKCHTWQRKEIENYLLSADLIIKGVAQRLGTRRDTRSPSEVEELIREGLLKVTEELKDHTSAQMLAQYQLEQRGTGKDPATVNLEFMRNFNSSWQSMEWRLARISGKEALHRLNQLLQAGLKVAVSPSQLVSMVDATSAPPELLSVLREISRFAAS